MAILPIILPDHDWWQQRQKLGSNIKGIGQCHTWRLRSIKKYVQVCSYYFVHISGKTKSLLQQPPLQTSENTISWGDPRVTKESYVSTIWGRRNGSRCRSKRCTSRKHHKRRFDRPRFVPKASHPTGKSKCYFLGCIYSGQIIIFHQPRFPWNKGISLTKPPFGVRSCEVAIIWPDIVGVCWCKLVTLKTIKLWNTP